MNRSVSITNLELQEKIKDKSIEKAVWLNNEMKLVVSEICSLLINACKFAINANAYICANDISKAKESGLCIVEIIESIPNLNDSVLCLSSEQFLYTEWEKRRESENCKYIFVPDLTAVVNEVGAVDEKATEKKCCDLKIKLEELERASWRYSVIICTDVQMDEELRRYVEDDSRLYYYLLGNSKLYLKENNAKEILELTCQLLENRGFQLDENFRNKLEIYIKAVYEGAVYKDVKFADDCVNRILQEHCKSLVESTLLGDKDVPYSEKANLLWAEMQKENNKRELEDAYKQLVEDIEPYCGIDENSAKDVNGNAGIFLVLSPINSNSKLALYEVAEMDGKSYKGIQTNDAPIQYLIDKVFSDGYNLKKIVCLTTDKTKEGTETYKRFCEFVELYIKKKWGKERIDISSILYESTTSEELNYSKFYSQLNAQVENLSAFYVDYTGGLRDTSFLMVVAIRFLEFKGIESKKVVYSDFFANPKQIKSLDKAYGLFQMINGMNEFVSSGTTRQLVDEFGLENENELTIAIRKFAHATNVGDVANIDGYINELNAALMMQDDTQELKNIMIQSMKDVIRKKIFGEATNAKLIERNEINYYRLIDWCIENKMYQQAVTLYVEKVPIVYYRDGVITDSLIDYTKVDSNMGGSKEATAFYTELPKWLLQSPDLEKLKDCIKEIRDSDIPDYKNDSSKFDEFINQIEDAFKDVDNNIRDRFIAIINQIYCDYDKADNIVGTIPVCFMKEDGTNNIPKNIVSFLNTTKNNERLMYYLLDGDLNRYNNLYERGDKKRNMRLIGAAYKRSLENPEQQKTNDDRYLCILMAFYLAIKILRNKMSHASEADNNDFIVENNLKNFFKESIKKDIGISLSENDIHNLLKEAMSYTTQAPKFELLISQNINLVDDSKGSGFDMNESIRNISIQNYNGNNNFKLYVQIVIYVLQQFSDRSATLAEIQSYVEGREGTMLQLPEKRALSEDGKQSGIKLIKSLCADIIRVEGEGTEARLRYIGN